MLLSYTLKQYNNRWIFGIGVCIVLFGIGIKSTMLKQHHSSLFFKGVHEVYNATVTDIPQSKANTFALTIKIAELDKQILAYIPKDTSSIELRAGDNITFFSEIKPFDRNNNPYDFDYARYMYNQGYAGYTFIQHDWWEIDKIERISLSTLPIKFRQAILNFYKSIDLPPDQIALLSALTLGYKNDLDNEILESFRVTGTAHVLAISGLHIGFIYVIILYLTYGLSLNGSLTKFRLYLSLALLWGYVIIIGLPPSAVRASIMLSLVTIGSIHRMNRNVFNSIFAAAFLIILVSPFSIFDIGFQLSFAAILAICFLQPIINKAFFIKNKILRYFWNLFSISIVAQIGVAPLCIYYFGTFPVYFFLTNIFILPLVTLIVYCGIGIALIHLFCSFISAGSSYIEYLPNTLFKLLVDTLLYIVRFFEKLPLATISNIEISILEIILIWIALFSLLYFYIRSNIRLLQIFATTVLLLFVCNLWELHTKHNTITIHDKRDSIALDYQIGYRKFNIESPESKTLICLNDKKYLIIVNNEWHEYTSTCKLKLDYLHLEGDKTISIHALTQIFDVKKIVLGNTLPKSSVRRLTLECEKLRIPYYDLQKNGTIRINF